ncbi:hypothetical protein FRC08_014781 [Ceratobasidium sp. 394]|nr:hypothetical protein FRC08_014781 [Ceratobasidium sp. 394]
MSNPTSDNPPLPLGASINKQTKAPNKARKPSILTKEDDAWFSEEHILRNGSLYKCLVCPENYSDWNKEWKTRGSMGAHQGSIVHSKYLEKMKYKKLKEQASTRLVLYYPTLSPYEPVENAIPVYFDPQWLIHYWVPAFPTVKTGVSLSSKGMLRSLREDGYVEERIQAVLELPSTFRDTGGTSMPNETTSLWKERKLVPTDGAWFSEEYIQRDGKKYKCLVCPKEASGRWRTRSGMGKHQTLSITHFRLVREAEKKKIKERVSTGSPPDSCSPSGSLDELAEDTTSFHHELPEPGECSGTEHSTDMSDAPLTPETQLKPLPGDGHINECNPGQSVGGVFLKPWRAWDPENGILRMGEQSGMLGRFVS